MPKPKVKAVLQFECTGADECGEQVLDPAYAIPVILVIYEDGKRELSCRYVSLVDGSPRCNPYPRDDRELGPCPYLTWIEK